VTKKHINRNDADIPSTASAGTRPEQEARWPAPRNAVHRIRQLAAAQRIHDARTFEAK